MKAVITMLALTFASGFALAGSNNADVKVDVDIKEESEKVGLKRLQIIEDLLSPDLIQNKRELVADIESDYNRKITDALKGIVSPVLTPKVSTHIDVNFFATDFNEQVSSKQNASVLIMIKNQPLDDLAKSHGGKEAALSFLKEVISSTFGIDNEKVTVVPVR